MSAPQTAPATPVERASAWAPLQNAQFRGLWLANIVSNIGTTMNDTAAIWTMTQLSSSPLLVALMQTMSGLPLFLLALPAGALADLVDRRKLILLAQLGALLTAAGMAYLAWTGQLTAPLLLVATFQLGVASAFTMPAWQAMIPELVGRKQLSSALALGSVGFNTARSLGPVAGGLLVAALGPGPVFFLNMISFGAVLIAAWRVRPPPIPKSTDQERMMGAIVAAVRYARHASPMQAVLLRTSTHVFAAVAPVALLPILIHRRGWTGSDYGLLMSCYGLGAIVVALFLLPKLRAKFSFDKVVVGAGLCSISAACLLSIAPDRITMGFALALAGAGWMTALNTFSVAAQSAFPNWVRARSSAIYLVAVQGAFALGALAWGRLLADWGATATLLTAATWMLISIALHRWWPISHVDKLDLTPANHWPEHTLTTIPAPEDGPVLITIEYRLAPGDEPAFREAMRSLRRVRLRDGAFRCSLFVDLNDPQVFRETFIVGSWAEHLRQHQRATVEDLHIEEAVTAFHQGSEPPRVRHLLMIEL
ncbi:MAG: MFS transporter [Verrucomicrobium sp.]